MLSSPVPSLEVHPAHFMSSKLRGPFLNQTQSHSLCTWALLEPEGTRESLLPNPPV